MDRESLTAELLDRIETLVLEAEAQTRPLEMPPYRERLFELFETAWDAGLLDGDADEDAEEPIESAADEDEDSGPLAADELTKQLAARWGLAESVQAATAQQRRMATEDVARMRLLWSLLRMWMEWAYAWRRYEERDGLR